MIYEIAVIYWTDAAIHGSECMSREAWISQASCVSGVAVGHILHETDDEITLAMDWFRGSVTGDDCFRIVSTYPKSGIQEIKRQTIKV
jgi:hypothetical protein